MADFKTLLQQAVSDDLQARRGSSLSSSLSQALAETKASNLQNEQFQQKAGLQRELLDTQNTAALEGREVRDGEIQTACQQTCPAHAITFGDLNDPASAVSQLAASELGYHVLEGLNTEPGVTYLTKVRNTVEA